MPVTYWAERVTDKLAGRLARSQAAIDAVIHRPVLRRPNTSALLTQYMTEPQNPEFQGQGRERLVDYLKQRYGTAARAILPYIIPQTAPPEEIPAEIGGSGYGPQ